MAREIETRLHQPKVVKAVLESACAFERIVSIAEFFYQDQTLTEDARLGFEQVLIEAERMILLLAGPTPKDDA